MKLQTEELGSDLKGDCRNYSLLAIEKRQRPTKSDPYVDTALHVVTFVSYLRAIPTHTFSCSSSPQRKSRSGRCSGTQRRSDRRVAGASTRESRPSRPQRSFRYLKAWNEKFGEFEDIYYTEMKRRAESLLFCRTIWRFETFGPLARRSGLVRPAASS